MEPVFLSDCDPFYSQTLCWKKKNKHPTFLLAKMFTKASYLLELCE